MVKELIYLADRLAEEEEYLLSHVGEPFDEDLDLALDDYGDHVDALQ